MASTFILVVGGANTGRSPMAAALLRRILDEYNAQHPERRLDWSVESAGVIGYDGDPAEPEAYNALLQFGLDISSHRARSLNAQLAERATVILAVDSGIVHVIRMQYPAMLARTVTIAALAGRQREIPDPANMLLGVWMSYAHEIDKMLRDGLAALIRRVEELQSVPGEQPPSGQPLHPPVQPPASQPPEPVARCLRLLQVMRDMPDLIAWDQARNQIETEIKLLISEPTASHDQRQVYGNMLLTLLKLTTGTPTPEQLASLATAIQAMNAPVDQQTLADLSVTLANW